jgi:hypothetical protein
VDLSRWGYEINEQGVGDKEIFVPGVSGFVGARDKIMGAGGGGTSHVDARTFIDARGATTDAIAALRSEMGQRDARLQAQLPQLIDNRVRDSRSRGRYG